MTPDDIRAAGERLRGFVRTTDCLPSSLLRNGAAHPLFLKREDQQRTGSFKERGAAHALATLSSSARTRGVVAASAGNHALGLAWHGRRQGVPVTLVMPRGAARVKVERCRALGAHVVLAGATFTEAEHHARLRAAAECATYVHPFADAAVIAGQGTVGLEVLAQLPECGTVVVPVGGGGLAAGVATIVKHVRPSVRIVAAEPAAAPKLSAALARGARAAVSVAPSLADGLAVSQLGAPAWEVARRWVDEVVVVSEAEIAAAMARLFEEERITVEGAGAVAVAAVLSGRIRSSGDGPTVAIVSGANVDARTFAHALTLATAPAGR